MRFIDQSCRETSDENELEIMRMYIGTDNTDQWSREINSP